MWGYIPAELDINSDFFYHSSWFSYLLLTAATYPFGDKKLSLQDCRAELECKWNIPGCPHVMQQMATGLQLLLEWLQLDRPVWLSVEITTYKSPDWVSWIKSSLIYTAREEGFIGCMIQQLTCTLSCHLTDETPNCQFKNAPFSLIQGQFILSLQNLKKKI